MRDWSSDVCSSDLEDYLVDIILPDLYFNDMDEKVYVEGLGEISADSDPIIVMAKLKNDL